MTETDVLRIVTSLILIVVLILALAWLARRAGWLRGSPTQPIQLLATRSLGGRAHLALVQVEDQRLLLGVTATQVSLLHALPPATTSIPPTAADGFAQSLQSVLDRGQ